MKLIVTKEEAQEIIRNFYKNPILEVEFTNYSAPWLFKIVLDGRAKTNATAAGLKIQLIKEVRVLTNWTLTSAKSATEGPTTAILQRKLTEKAAKDLIGTLAPCVQEYFSIKAECPSPDVQTLDI